MPTVCQTIHVVTQELIFLCNFSKGLKAVKNNDRSHILKATDPCPPSLSHSINFEASFLLSSSELDSFWLGGVYYCGLGYVTHRQLYLYS